MYYNQPRCARLHVSQEKRVHQLIYSSDRMLYLSISQVTSAVRTCVLHKSHRVCKCCFNSNIN